MRISYYQMDQKSYITIYILQRSVGIQRCDCVRRSVIVREPFQRWVFVQLHNYAVSMLIHISMYAWFNLKLISRLPAAKV